jgi:ATP/maltotriose-dependent transcriptional regulator MalT
MGFGSEFRDLQSIRLADALDGGHVIRSTTDLLTRTYGFHMSWVAESVDGGVVVGHMQGNRTKSFQGVLLRDGQGLGGKVHASGRLRFVDSYFDCADISHEYDRHVADEELRRAVAAPMIAGDRDYGVLLAGSRDAGEFGAQAAEAIESMAQRCAESLYLAERVRAGLAAAIEEDRRRTLEVLRDLVETTQTSIAAKLRETRPLPRNLEGRRRRLRAIEDEAQDATARLRCSEFGLPAPWPTAGYALHVRESQILRLIGHGLRTREIAADLGISAETVKWYLKGLFTKLEVRTRAQAVVSARRLGILP